eukprot:c26474_g2_i1 orf=422-2932(+)
MAASLTPNAILSLNSGNVDLRPLVQVLDIRQIGTAQSVQERYRLVLSDGNYVQQAMLATQLNELVKSGQVQKGTIVQLMEYICNTVQQRRIIIVLNMEVIATMSEIIGDPKQVISTDQSAAAASSASFQQQQQRTSPPVASSQFQQVQPFVNTGAGADIPPMSSAHTKIDSGTQGGCGSYTASASMSVRSVNTEAGKFPNPQANTYGRPVVAPSYQPPPIYSNKGSITRNEAPARIVPIAALNPYQGRWTIKARVTAKGDLRRFNNARGDGKVFHFDLLDAEGGEIRVTCFNTVAEQFHDRIELGKVYMISKGSLKAAQKNFNHLKNEWEIFLENSSTVEQCIGEDDSIPHQHFDFQPISEIENMDGNTMVDVIGLVVAINPCNTIMRRNGTETQKRSLQLRDMSGRSVELTMWGAFCTREGQQLQDICDSGHVPVLAVRAGRISDFSGKSVGTISTTQLSINPDLPEAHVLRQWFELEGKNTPSQSISHEMGNGSRIEMRKTVSQIKDEGLGRSDKPDWIAMKATISFIKTDNFCYTACPLPVGDRQCNKKVMNNGDGTWRCDRCDKSVPDCDYRYLLSVQVQDHTGVTWVTAFQEAGEEIMGVTAKELYMWKQDEGLRFSEVIQKLLFTSHLFKLKVKEENYNDEQRVKCTVVKSDRLVYVVESRVLLDLIGKFSRGDSVSGHVTTASVSIGSMAPGYGSASLGYGRPTFSGSGQGGTQRGLGFGEGSSICNGPSAGLGIGYCADGSSNVYSGTACPCYKCGRGDHLPRDCPNGPNGPNGLGGGGQKGSSGGLFSPGGSMHSSNSCFKCGQGGHWARDCPNQGGYGNGGYGRSY